MHIDHFIDYGTSRTKEIPKNEAYARWMFNHFRLPATQQMAFDQFMSGYKLFCTYEGKKYRVTGASRLGDVWLTSNFNRDSGYELRVELEECSGWDDK